MDHTFQSLVKRLEKELHQAEVETCLHLLTEGEVLFSPGFTQDRERLLSLLELRYDTAASSSGERFEAQDLVGWKRATEALRKSDAPEVHQQVISSDFESFFFYWDSQSQEMIAAFRLPHYRSMKDWKTYNDDIIRRGYTVSSSLYRKGVLVRAW